MGERQVIVTTTRRQFLSRVGLGASAVAVAGATGLTWRAWDQGVFDVGEGPAYRAWRSWRDATGAERAVGAAILAASAHNSQPWAFVLDGDRIELHADPERSIGTVDPFLRERDTSLGCALENLVIALEAQGRTTTVTIPGAGGPDSLAACIDTSPGSSRRGAAFDALARRHSNRGRYRDEPLPAGFTEQLSSSVDDSLAPVRLHWLTARTERATYAGLIIDAVEELIHDDQQSLDSHAWYRHDWDQVQRRKDGITPDAQASPRLMRSAVKLLPATSRSTNDGFFLDSIRDTVPTSAAFGLITVPDPGDATQRLLGGRLVQRLHLAATSHGVAFQHLNPVTERIDRRRQLGLDDPYTGRIAQLTGQPDRELLISFRVGMPAADARRSPRRPLSEVLR